MSRFAFTRPDVVALAADAGLALVGITGAEPFAELLPYLVDHVERGHVRGMDWFTVERACQSCDPRTLHAGARSIVSLAVPYWSGPATPPDDGVLRGRIARYAWGRDYHNTLKKRMKAFVAAIQDAVGHEVDARLLVDTARIVDRAVGARVGTGGYGNITMIIVLGDVT